MMIVFMMLGIALAALGVFLILRGVKRKSPEIMSEEFAELTRGCCEYNALVLDVHKEPVSGGRKKQRVMILQIRFEEQKRTVIHKCTENFYGKYSRGERIKVLFREGSREDFCIPAEDNRFTKEKRFGGKMFAVSTGVMLVLMGLGLAGGAALLMK